MKNKILKRKLDGSFAVITHWDHFHVNRETGSVIHKAFTVKYLSGKSEGMSFVWPISFIDHSFEVVGNYEEQIA